MIDFKLLQFFLIGFSLTSAICAFALMSIDSIKNKKHKQKRNRHLEQEKLIQGSLVQNVRETTTQIESDIDKILHKIAALDIKSIKKSTNSFEASYEKELEDLNKELQTITAEAINTTKKTYTDKLNVFIEELLKTGLSTQTLVDKKTAELLSITDDEINKYKQVRMEKIDQEIKEKIDKIYKEVLKKSMPENLQNELIIKSLEEAKKDEVFKL